MGQVGSALATGTSTEAPLLPQEVIRCAFLAARRVVDDDRARDVAQECWVKFRGQAAREGPDWPPGRARAWVQRVASNAAIELLRKAQPEPLRDEPAGEDPAERAAEREELARWGALFWEVFAELPRARRELFALRVVEGREWSDVAAILHERPGTLRTQFTRLRRELREAIERRRAGA